MKTNEILEIINQLKSIPVRERAPIIRLAMIQMTTEVVRRGKVWELLKED